MITSISKQFLLFSMNKEGKLSSIKNHKILFVAICLVELYCKNYISIKDNRIYIERKLTNEVMHLIPLYNYIENAKPLKAKRIVERYIYTLNNKNFNELYSSVFTSLHIECKTNMNEQFLENEKKRLIYEIKKYDDFGYIDDKSIIILSLSLLKGNLLKGYITKQEVSNLKVVLKDFSNEQYIKIIVEIINDIASVTMLLLSSLST